MLKRLTRIVDPYIVAILLTVAIASLLPARGAAAGAVDGTAETAVALLFFLYGARLSPQAVLEGIRHWRLHIVVLVSTFVLFPLLGLAAHALVPAVLTPELYIGLVFLCALPSTVQSSIAFTSIARGNVAAAICGASLSNLLGIVLTPLIVGLLLATSGGLSAEPILDIAVQLLLPFVAGQLLRRWIGDWIARHRRVLGLADKGAILLVVYSAFSQGVQAGIWQQLPVPRLLGLVAVNVVLLGVVLLATGYGSRWLGFPREDRIAIVFCGSKKSLASGVPMAAVLFADQSVGLIVLPLMLFHQIQLMACAALARRYAAAPARSVAVAPAPAS
ncbi:solute carrier family 10 (sodium/bile acid cotransporter), member 7 [Amycolatopsis arida]|uniref:Solute carrier family 10 (Sodium/bile acid cotransporter), member 7 n=1 Tax=Amycolatopsis arida TaxID=587909 RepID=A0A1I5SEH3_9PSEU|nr:bile acid:sodium symporter family protein [Amycolatopsis arida]TDX96501.1 sodium/bile acid cotransporter 7 [Amycolatopsis arida]SFP69120.1 solute carrier family 10 (sodium/bile acid cotransporter), member 7 [Amycolatopsis arida]